MPKKKQDEKPSWRHEEGITRSPVDDYLYAILPKRDEVLSEMEEYASAHNVPIVGPAVARVLQQFAMLINTKTVFELGSAIGYSTIWWAQAVGEKGRVIYTDGDSKMPSAPADISNARAWQNASRSIPATP